MAPPPYLKRNPTGSGLVSVTTRAGGAGGGVGFGLGDTSTVGHSKSRLHCKHNSFPPPNDAMRVLLQLGQVSGIAPFE